MKRFVFTLLVVLPLAGCASFKLNIGQSPPKPPAPIVSDIKRQIPNDCETLAVPVPLPPVTKGQNAKKSLAEHRAALVTADGRLDATRNCEAQVRQDLSK